ncbi:hypothetical protein PFICI_12113 [Pestalotiopsis fici W106-1]|uniref:Nephrocystin 3-like N-terminal domain-containing protein n=1 Tax=Pestalotiopsis fici (strain W106-1 / CGMCC3.15140) TaxID=1229662 RepID=W3WV64_PESFW|nr:uncharacterized protein PFICI_12113 [Pestalotiopsis fici W106-1]ETS76726.1 hypothetical protein PFICI_12113 [Pestalotiopsis fici W106-1]
MNIGLQEVYLPPEGVEAVANICFVHGLFGGPWKSFSAKRPRSDAQSPAQAPDGSSTNQGPGDAKAAQQVFWPRDLLPRSINNVRIFTFGYDADIGRIMGAAGLNSLYQHARNLLNATSDLLEQTPEPLPIIFVAHSLGGLVVKQALNQSATSTDARKNRTLGYTRGIIFLGTPHHGSSAAMYGRTAFRLSKKIAFQSANIKLLTALERNSEPLDQLSTEFCETLEKTNVLRMWSFCEEKQVRFGVVGMQIVPADSARIRHIKEDWGSISGDHRQIAKYSSTQDDGFVKVNNVLKGWVRDIERDPQNNFSESEEYKECLKTLDDADARLRVQGVHQVSQTNSSSFEWLFTEQVPFTKWLQDDTNQFSPVFWITGRPGSGKSTLMRFALEDRRTVELLPESTGSPLAYFFHLRGKSTTQKSLKGMLKELLYQLLHQFPHFYAQIGPIYKRRVRMLVPREWDLDSLAEGFLQIPNLVSRSKTTRDRVFLFIDALDENENQHENETMMSLIKRLSAEYESTAKNSQSPLLKICLASRSWTLFQRELGENQRIPSLAIHEFTTNDIRSYASALLDEPLQSLRLPVAHQSESLLVSEITGRANGVFVWVRVVVDNLRRHIIDGTSIEVLRTKVLEYPQELKDMYEYTVTRIPEDYWKELEVALKVLYSSQKALTLSELYVITQICIDQHPPWDFEASQRTLAWLASRSGGLIEEITISPTPGYSLDQQQPGTISSVQFIHQTVQDFVRAGIRGLPEPTYGGPRLLIPSGHYLITFACLENRTPHTCLSEVAKDVFSYFRECERDWDTRGRLNDSYIGRWTSTYLIESLFDGFDINRPHEVLYFFMNEPDRRKMVKIIAGLQGEDLSVDEYFDNSTSHGERQATVAPSPESMRKTLIEAVSTVHQGQSATSRQPAIQESANLNIIPVRKRLQKAIRAVMALNRCSKSLFSDVMLFCQNLYYPRFRDRDVNSERLVTMAALGQRLAKDRTDRPRMLKKYIAYTTHMDFTGPQSSGWRPTPMALDVGPAPEVFWEQMDLPIVRVATAIPSSDITDAMLRHMTELLLEHPSQLFGNLDSIVQIPFMATDRLSVFEYCAIFKRQDTGKWLQLILRHAPSLYLRYPNILRRVLFLKMGLTHEDEEPDMKQGLVFPGLLAAASSGLSLRHLYQGLYDPALSFRRAVL